MGLFAAFTLSAAACGGVASPVPVAASPADRDAFAGEWRGWYRSLVTGRTGSIVLTIPADSRTATGDVLTARRPAVVASREARPDGTTVAGAAVDSVGVIEIQAVRLRGSQMLGELAPYFDADCRCTPHTVFRGERSGDRIQGTFRGRGAPEGATEGTFELRRVRRAVRTDSPASDVVEG